MNKRWIFKNTPEARTVEALCKSINVSSQVAQLLLHRGICDYDEAFRFFRPQLHHLHDPFLMKNMEKATTRLLQAIQENEPVLFFGDYDVDGTTAVSMMYIFFRDVLRYPHVQYYLPDRYKEGYGISRAGIDFAEAQGIHLIISLDCGIRANEQVAYACEKNIEFIICDHHLPGPELPPAFAILNPKQQDCPYPYKELSGCGVGFKLVQAIARRLETGDEAWLPLLDLVATSTCCDIVPLTGENRVLVHFGLQQLNKNPRPGLAWIKERSGLQKDFTVEDVVFIIGPRINAAGRILHGSGAVDLLISEEGNALLEKQGEALNRHNEERRGLDKEITKQALAMIATDDGFGKKKSTVVFRADWHKGVIGIVASRLVEKHYRPTIVLTQNQQMATGSARSIPGFDVHAAIEQCAELLETFGGHTHAAGLTMRLENLEAFREKFDLIVSSFITDDMLTPRLDIDLPLDLWQITPKFYQLLKQFAPFGPQNMNPVFMASDAVIADTPRIVGDNHLKLTLKDAKQKSFMFQAIAFNQGEHFAEIASGKPFQIAYSLSENTWMGKTSLQLDIKDISFRA